jgi:hypothetical protein
LLQFWFSHCWAKNLKKLHLLLKRQWLKKLHLLMLLRLLKHLLLLKKPLQLQLKKLHLLQKLLQLTNLCQI